MPHFNFKKLTVVFTTLLLTLFFTSCGSNQVILTNVAELDANQILVLLESKGIFAEKSLVKTSGAAAGQTTDNMWDISVDSSKAIEALAILNRIGLPRPTGVSLLDLFPQQGMMKTDTEEQIRYNEGLNLQLANTLRKIDGILDVEVQVAFPKDDSFNPDAPKEYPRASVFIKHDGIMTDPNNLLFQKIRRYISGSIVDLRYEDVTIMTDRARFTDINLRTLEPKSELSPWGNQDFVKIWSIVVSQQSVSAFRTILFLFCFLLLVLILAISWMAWKLQDVFRQVKNVKSLFTLDPLKVNLEKDEPKPDENL